MSNEATDAQQWLAASGRDCASLKFAVLYLSWRVGQSAGVKLPAFRKPNVGGNFRWTDLSQEMEELIKILRDKYPPTQERIEGRLVYLDKLGTENLDFPTIKQKTELDFFKAKFSTGYRKFSIIDVVIGKSQNNEIFLLTNPLFSDRYSSLINEMEKIKGQEITADLNQEIIELFRVTGATITTVADRKYQIWMGDNKWRVMDFKTNGTLKIKTTPNYKLDKKRNWWQKLFLRLR